MDLQTLVGMGDKIGLVAVLIFFVFTFLKQNEKKDEKIYEVIKVIGDVSRQQEETNKMLQNVIILLSQHIGK